MGSTLVEIRGGTVVRTMPDGSKKPFGDDKPKKGKFAGLVVTAGIGATLVVGFSGAGEGIGATPEVSVGESASVTVRSARTGRQKAERTRSRLSARNADVRVRGRSDTQDCAATATGEVRQFLLESPCRSLQRASFEVTPTGRDRVVVAVAWIRMPDREQAVELKSVVDSPGTGQIRPLDRRITLSGQNYASRLDGDLVITAEAEPYTRTVPARALEQLARQGAE